MVNIDIVPNLLVPELSIVDFQKSLAFYTKVLGFSVAYQRKDEGFAFLTLDGVHIMIDQIGIGRTWRTGKLEYPLGRGINFQIIVDKLDPILDRIKKSGTKLFLDVEERWYRMNDQEVGNRQFLVMDPDGYLLRFVQDLGRR
jgi:catechol 2,3-dioxygenase-like lactoylglutathione lyase family enzyme